MIAMAPAAFGTELSEPRKLGMGVLCGLGLPASPFSRSVIRATFAQNYANVRILPSLEIIRKKKSKLKSEVNSNFYSKGSIH
jgi:hypothetical protein